MAFLGEIGGDEAALDAATAQGLSKLGITRVAILRNRSTLAYFVEGWAFDAQVSGAAACEILLGGKGVALTELAEVNLAKQLRDSLVIDTDPSHASREGS